MEAYNRRVWAIRGATTVSSDDPALIDEAVGELLSLIYKENHFSEEDVAFTLFSQTSDLRSRNAAAAARRNGFSTHSPLFCVQEAEIDGMLERAIRVMIEVEKDNMDSPKMIYLRGASGLRPDLKRN